MAGYSVSRWPEVGLTITVALLASRHCVIQGGASEDRAICRRDVVVLGRTGARHCRV